MTGRSQTPFVLRVEDELRRRRDRDLERCVGCGKKIQRATDYTRVRAGLMHADCADAPVAAPVAPAVAVAG